MFQGFGCSCQPPTRCWRGRGGRAVPRSRRLASWVPPAAPSPPPAAPGDWRSRYSPRQLPDWTPPQDLALARWVARNAGRRIPWSALRGRPEITCGHSTDTCRVHYSGLVKRHVAAPGQDPKATAEALVATLVDLTAAAAGGGRRQQGVAAGGVQQAPSGTAGPPHRAAEPPPIDLTTLAPMCADGGPSARAAREAHLRVARQLLAGGLPDELALNALAVRPGGFMAVLEETFCIGSNNAMLYQAPLVVVANATATVLGWFDKAPGFPRRADHPDSEVGKRAFYAAAASMAATLQGGAAETSRATKMAARCTPQRFAAVLASASAIMPRAGDAAGNRAGGRDGGHAGNTACAGRADGTGELAHSLARRYDMSSLRVMASSTGVPVDAAPAPPDDDVVGPYYARGAHLNRLDDVRQHLTALRTLMDIHGLRDREEDGRPTAARDAAAALRPHAPLPEGASAPTPSEWVETYLLMFHLSHPEMVRNAKTGKPERRPATAQEVIACYSAGSLSRGDEGLCFMNAALLGERRAPFVRGAQAVTATAFLRRLRGCIAHPDATGVADPGTRLGPGHTLCPGWVVLEDRVLQRSGGMQSLLGALVAAVNDGRGEEVMDSMRPLIQEADRAVAAHRAAGGGKNSDAFKCASNAVHEARKALLEELDRAQRLRGFDAGAAGLTDEEAARAARAFAKYDLNDDGTLSFEEFRKLCAQVAPELSTDEEVRAALAEIDTNCDGSVDFLEFVSFWQKQLKERA